MKDGSPPCNPRPIGGVNNNADTIPCYSQSYSGRHVAQSLVSKYVEYTPNARGICFNTCNEIVAMPDCRNICNNAVPGSDTFSPTLCSTLDFNLNEESVKLKLRSEVPHLNRRDISKLRLPFYELLCHELLEKGYHLAFSDLFNLHQRQEEQRRNAGPDCQVWFIPPLAEQGDKIVLLAHHLAQAEAARRRMDQHTVFVSYLTLGLAFQSCPDDLWVAEHFFKLALEVSRTITDDNGYKSALANQYYGLILQNNGDLDGACDCLSEFYRLTRDKEWKDENGMTLKKLAAVSLAKNYLLKVDKTKEDFYSDRLVLAKKAKEIAEDCDNWDIQASIWQKIGELYEAATLYSDAIEHYQQYFEEAYKHEHYKNIGQACEALARLCQKENKFEDSLRYLQKYAILCERNGDWKELIRACQMLGTAYDAIGDHTSALMWMRKAYNMPNLVQCLKQKLSPGAIEKARIMIGVSRAHMMNPKYITTIQSETSAAILKLTGWKANPKDEHKIFTEASTLPITLVIPKLPKPDRHLLRINVFRLRSRLIYHYTQLQQHASCYLPSKIDVWNVKEENQAENKPSFQLDTTANASSIKFSNDRSSIIAGGSLVGELQIWDLTSDYKQTEFEQDRRFALESPGGIQCLEWIQFDGMSRTMSGDKAHIITAGGGGMLICWSVSDLSIKKPKVRIVKKYQIKIPSTARRVARHLESGSITREAQFSLDESRNVTLSAIKFSHFNTSQLIVGTECGYVLACKVNLELLSTGDRPNRILIGQSGDDSSPVQSVLAQDCGQVYTVDWNRYHHDLALSCAFNEGVRLYNVATRRSALLIANATETVLSAQFSPHYATVFACTTNTGSLHLYKIGQNDSGTASDSSISTGAVEPLVSVKASRLPLMTLAFNNADPTLLAVGCKDGTVSILSLTGTDSLRSTNRDRVMLEALANSLVEL